MATGGAQPAYDVTGVVDRLGGDRAFLAECVDLFAAELPPMMAALRDSVNEASPEKVQATAHALKGMTSNFCQEGPARTADRIDALAREGRLSDASRLLAQLEDELVLLQAALQHLRDNC